MSVQHHFLKCETEYYQAVETGIKTFEIRKNDRDYKVNDIIHLKEVVNGIETGKVSSPKVITYISHGGEYGSQESYCILRIKDL